MLFNSYIFLLVFLPLCLTGYFGLNRFKQYKLSQGFLLLMSLWFYGYFNPYYLLIILSSIVVNYCFSTTMITAKTPLVKKAVLWAGIVFNLGILFYFKYYDFFIENVNILFRTSFTMKHILLPLGISFFTFQQLSYVIDSYEGEVPKYDFIKYASFVTYFPQLIAGPIVTHDELIPQFEDESKKQINWDNMSAGIFIFALGLGKKVLIADVFGNAVNYGFGNIAKLDSTNAILTMLAYTVQIYFDFSGYCDMAIGLGKMMNFDIPVNFNSPYKALNISDFWDRWHITLTRFFKKYLYIKIGGNRKGKVRTYANIIIVFLVSGLWHGANRTFVLWGLLHGIGIVFYRHFKDKTDKLHPAFNWLCTFSFINFTWLLFRAPSIKEAVTMAKKIFALNFGKINSEILGAFNLPEWNFLFNRVLKLNFLKSYPNTLLLVYYVGALVLLLGFNNGWEQMNSFKPTARKMIFSAVLVVWCAVSFAGVSTFLYFNF